MTWHVTQRTARAYVDGEVSDADAWSVEAHLVSCGHCRTVVASTAGDVGSITRDIADGWAAVSAGLGQQGRVRRGSRYREVVMLVASGPAARWAWLAASVVGLALAAALDTFAPLSGRGDVPMLGAVAPMVPILGVALSYGSGLDDAQEIIASTPGGGLRLLLVRSAVVLTTSAALGAAAGAVSGYGSPLPWLLASLALTVVTLALGSVIGIPKAAAVAAFSWALGVTIATFDTPARTTPAALTTESVPVWLAVAATAALVVAVRRSAFDRQSVSDRPQMEM
ncbi:zf-HC2 domain-containing protein [Phytoactinopolyspora halotolerans]|uniref:Zf-HC2 domain-containing protein n=1 Tax=Phytoactinopolyspora halotolerans TaxID=1981512 RepID=A0A6L9SEC3_9ACTN|nr:zf-HC2 domain-containing protein [Phytoactinopolyspora halotolerans]NEE03437.1 zf-HC2 domain-containing protein [Phytoactinopolyspora halotolerans]